MCTLVKTIFRCKYFAHLHLCINEILSDVFLPFCAKVKIWQSMLFVATTINKHKMSVNWSVLDEAMSFSWMKIPLKSHNHKWHSDVEVLVYNYRTFLSLSWVGFGLLTIFFSGYLRLNLLAYLQNTCNEINKSRGPKTLFPKWGGQRALKD